MKMMRRTIQLVQEPKKMQPPEVLYKNRCSLKLCEIDSKTLVPEPVF